MNKENEYYKWYPYYEFPDRYEINKMGQVRNIRTGMVLSGTIKKNDGYIYYGLKDSNGKTYSRAAHIMVAKQFLPNNDNTLIVNHIDENRANPCVDNLEWISRRDNINHGTAQKRKGEKIQRPVSEYNKEGKYIRTWKSVKCIVEFVEGREVSNTRTDNVYNRIRTISEKNNKDIKKRLLYDRIFIMEVGDVDCQDLPFFYLAEDKNNSVDKRKDLFFDHQDIPDRFIFHEETKGQKVINILNDILSRTSTHEEERMAIEYAIKCVMEVEGN